MTDIIYTNSWRKEPFLHGRPFVSLADYENLQERHELALKQVRELKARVEE